MIRPAPMAIEPDVYQSPTGHWENIATYSQLFKSARAIAQKPVDMISVAIFAQGPVGLCATAGARARGAGLIITVESVPERIEASKRFGANVVINPKEKDPASEIMSLTNGRGVDVTVEAVGLQETFGQATRAVRRGGTVSSIGVYGVLPQVWMATMAPSFYHRKIVPTICPGGYDRLNHL